MEEIILDRNIILNGSELINIVNIVEVDEEQMIANVNISNTQIYLSVPLSLIGVEHSIRDYLSREIKVETND